VSWCHESKAGVHDTYTTRGGKVICVKCKQTIGEPPPIASTHEAQRKQEIGLGRAVTKSGPEWVKYAIEFLHQYAREHLEVFCDDIWLAGLERPESPRAFGQVMKHAIREGWIVKHGEGRPSRQGNLSVRPVYRSTLWKSEV